MDFIWGLGNAQMKDLGLFLGQGGVMKSPLMWLRVPFGTLT